jgi:hypothetical protein
MRGINYRRVRSGVWAALFTCIGIAAIRSLPLLAQDADLPQCKYVPTWTVFQRGEEVLEHFITGQNDGYRVLLPAVTAFAKEYRAVTLRPGDELTVEACGCVQTGGKGLTWKRYVSPQGPNSDRLYHGSLILFGTPKTYAALPTRTWQSNGTTFTYVRINDLMNAQRKGFRLPIDTQHFLTLGFEDDEYGDNGYSGHDDGTDGQCKGVGGATVEIVIKRK